MGFFQLCADNSLVINRPLGFVNFAINESPDVFCYPIGFVLYQLHKIWHMIVPDAGIVQVWSRNLV